MCLVEPRSRNDIEDSEQSLCSAGNFPGISRSPQVRPSIPMNPGRDAMAVGRFNRELHGKTITL